MDTKKEMKELIREEVIQFLKNTIIWRLGDESPIGKYEYKKRINNVINFLKWGWKFEKMWEEIFNEVHPEQMKQIFSIKSKFFPEDLNHYSLTTLRKLKKDLEQKYFPKVDKVNKV